ncbi:DNA repair protein RadA [Flavobacteriales bacterium]|jgi:DNA repair protein RadA/Sms|nr:DNA repair protein RadA [Flavobacteriales bacterium]MDA7578063.1 DNA repair protein RadA [Flavobacteriales bacterium]MDA7596225.1 DNA repair protein RadA [Flavobacteriales bacterium]
MAKKKTQSAFFCQSCGTQSPKWLGKCPQCNEWNTFVEEIITKNNDPNGSFKSTKINKPTLVSNIDYTNEKRIVTNDNELNRVLGGGIVPGSLILLGGDPGIGKSTLLLQFALSSKSKKILYVSGEESEKQIKMRAERINRNSEHCYILTETSTQNIFQQIEKLQPDILVVDSIQTLHTANIDSSPGSVSQIRECTAELIKYAKETSTAVFLIGHINKDGAIAGPKILEHMVDTVLQFEGDRNHVYRILRTIKNRFGSASELGVYEMNQEGLREVSNPSEILISERDEATSGVGIAATIEGARPLLVEIQSLVSSAVYGTPQRSATGYDTKRMNMLLAVLEKRCGFRLGAKDVFLNITGGIKIDDTAIDLAVVCSILSSDHDLALNTLTCFAGEIGLSGEIRAVNRIESRIAEAEKLGYNKIIISKYNKFNPKGFNIEIIQCGKIEQVFKLLF